MKTILTIVVIIIAYAITRIVIWNSEAAQPAANSVAVLPFESLSPEKQNVMLASGVYDGVSTRLAREANHLKVISHYSVAKYRGACNTHEIGRALNVAYVLKASVCLEPREECRDRIHINAQLIDTRTEARVWAQEYDRELCKVGSLQGEVAQDVWWSVSQPRQKSRIPPNPQRPDHLPSGNQKQF
jgi:TolB-like protein